MLINRVCKECKESLPLTNEFFRPEKNKTGWSYKCRNCIRRYCKQYYEANREMLIQASRERALKDHEKYKRGQKKWYYDNLEREQERHRQWNRVNSDYLKEYTYDYRKNNPQRIKEYNEKRKEKNHDITNKEWDACKEYFDYACAYCGLSYMEHKEIEGQDLHKEHVIHDGRNDLKNCVPSCRSCNSEKNTRTINDWYNCNNQKYTYKRYHKIYQWMRYDCLKFILKKRRNKKQEEMI